MTAFRVLFAACVLQFVACATVPQQSAEERVRARALERVNLFMTSEFEKSYAFTTPGYRQTSTLQQYITAYAGAGMWKAVGVESVACEAERCEVLLNITYTMPRMPFDNTTLLPETWIYTKDDWYLFRE